MQKHCCILKDKLFRRDLLKVLQILWRSSAGNLEEWRRKRNNPFRGKLDRHDKELHSSQQRLYFAQSCFNRRLFFVRRHFLAQTQSALMQRQEQTYPWNETNVINIFFTHLCDISSGQQLIWWLKKYDWYPTINGNWNHIQISFISLRSFWSQVPNPLAFESDLQVSSGKCHFGDCPNKILPLVASISHVLLGTFQSIKNSLRVLEENWNVPRFQWNKSQQWILKM